MEGSDGITVRETADRGRGVFATRALEQGATLVRAIPAASVPSDAYLRTCCCICLQRTECLPCAACGAAVLCARCARSKGASLIHEDECASLRMLFATEDRPADTRSLRLLMRLLLWRWRCSQPGEAQYIDEGSDDEGVAENGGGGSGGSGGGGGGGGGDALGWWGDGDACGDTPEDLMDLCEPPEEEAWEGGEALEQVLLEIAAQARYYLPAHTRLSRHLAAEIMGRVYCNALALYEDVPVSGKAHGKAHGKARGAATAAKARGRAPTMPSLGAEVGMGLSASVAMLNHCCEPNADRSLDAGGCLVVRALRPIRCGEELCLSYVETSLPAAERKAHLSAHFGFECGCARCSAE